MSFLPRTGPLRATLRAVRRQGPAAAKAWRSHRGDLRLLCSTAVFGPEWYRSRYPDVAASGLGPCTHHLRHGASEGRDPGPGFDTRAYLAADPGLAQAGGDLLPHYRRTVGRKAGSRSPWSPRRHREGSREGRPQAGRRRPRERTP